MRSSSGIAQMYRHTQLELILKILIVNKVIIVLFQCEPNWNRLCTRLTKALEFQVEWQSSRKHYLW